MFDFCPFDFKQIDVNNLAYELVFAGDWTWQEVKDKTVVGKDTPIFINDRDHRREEYLGLTQNDTEHVVLLEVKKKGAKNGFQLFLDMVEFNNNKLRQEAVEKEAEISEEKEAWQGSFQYDASGFAGASRIALEHKKINGIHTFVDEKNEPVMSAMPCCPHCHNRLPIGWDEAEDFGAVSLMAPTTGGKTTFLYSMMHDKWGAFKNLGSINGQTLTITPAHRENDPTDTVYWELEEASKKMCKDYGKCPENTRLVGYIPPVFLQVEYAGHIMIIGIYDNAGENLRKINPIKMSNLRMLLDKMFADIYLFDPKHMNIILPGQKEAVLRSHFSECKMLEIEEQGDYQAENSQKVISAQELLYEVKSGENDEEDVIKLLDVYNSNYNIRAEYHCMEEMRKMYFLGVIVKSDLLENAEEIKKSGEYDTLFDRNSKDDMLDINQMTARSDQVEEMINVFNLFGDKNLDDFRVDYGETSEVGGGTGRKAVSWHCISALGCDALLADRLLGKYSPIRVAEPLVTCIIKRIADNGWL